MTTAVWVLTVIAVLVFLRFAQTLFVPIALAGLISYALYPLLRRLERLKIPRTVGAALILLTLGTAAAWGAYALKDDATATLRTLPEQAREIRQRMESGTGGWWQRLQHSVAELQRAAQPGVQGRVDEQRAEPAPGARPALGQYIWAGSVNAAWAVGQLAVIIFLVYFLLISAGEWRDRIVEVAGPSRSDERTAAEILDAISWQVQRFLLARVATAVLVAIATWLALRLIGIPQPAVWGVLAGVFNSIPYFGPIIVSGGLAIVGLVSGGFPLALQAAGLALAITALEGWVVTPPLLGQAARMNTLAVFIGLLVWSWVWNIWGTILAVPILAVIKAFADHIPRLRKLSQLLSA